VLPLLLPYKPKKGELVLPTTVDFVNELARIPEFFVSVRMAGMNGSPGRQAAARRKGAGGRRKKFTQIKYACIPLSASVSAV
jgi:hypothetical protein